MLEGWRGSFASLLSQFFIFSFHIGTQYWYPNKWFPNNLTMNQAVLCCELWLTFACIQRFPLYFFSMDFSSFFLFWLLQTWNYITLLLNKVLFSCSSKILFNFRFHRFFSPLKSVNVKFRACQLDLSQNCVQLHWVKCRKYTKLSVSIIIIIKWISHDLFIRAWSMELEWFLFCLFL